MNKRNNFVDTYIPTDMTRYFDLILFITLIAIAIGQYALDLIGLYGFLALLSIALIGLFPMRLLIKSKPQLKLLLQRITGKAQR